MDDERERLLRALGYARSIIRNYQADIRASEWTGVDLAAKGFCQGIAYQRALEDIDAMAKGEPTREVPGGFFDHQ